MQVKLPRSNIPSPKTPEDQQPCLQEMEFETGITYHKIKNCMNKMNGLRFFRFMAGKSGQSTSTHFWQPVGINLKSGVNKSYRN